jgi:Asp-tRNA(Asn)/Glu-tRNA(Gln) amidotransferase A subunit family amidase
MPIGMQVAAMPFAEGMVFRCGRAIERIVGTPRRPTLG